jgi:hypothetical protein
VISSPYKGLAPFEDTELDSLLFFGREREIGIISANVLASRLTVLYGPSGVGKSSLLRAGVAHGLRAGARENVEERGHPEYVVVVYDQWSDDPVAALRQAVHDALAEQFGSALLDEVEGEPLADTFGRWTEALACDLLLVLDQAEEYFLYHAEETGFARELPELVTRPRLRVRVLLALRDDALAKLDRFKGRIPNLFSNYLRLDHLDRASAREAVVRPVERYNEASGQSVEVEPALINDVLDQTAAGKVDLGEAGRGLAAGESDQGRIEAPYLQLVLERVWDEEREAGSDVLRAQTLAELGGAESIVRTNLHRAVEELTQEEQDVAADIFRFLVTPSGTKIAHGAGDLAEYASVDEREVRPVLATLGRERIVRPVDGAGGNGARYEIFHDVLGDAVLAWRRERERDRERRAAARRQRRLFAIAMVALLALAAMTAVAIYAFSQRSNARAESRRAHARALQAQATRDLDVDPQLSILLALEAAKTDRGAETQDVLSRAIEASRMRGVRRVSNTAPIPGPPGGHLRIAGKLLPRGVVDAVARSPDGKVIATGHGDKTLRLWSSKTGKPLKVVRGHEGHVVAVAFSPDGKLIATGSTDGTGRLWTSSGDFIGPLIGHTGQVTAVAFNPSSTLVATASRDRTVRVWKTTLGQLPLVLRGHTGAVSRVRFTPDGSRIVTVSTDGTERTWDPEPEPQMHVIQAGGERIRPSRVAEGAGKRATVDALHKDQVILDDLDTGERSRLVGQFGTINGVGISPDGRWVVTAGPFSAGLWRSSSSGIHTYLRATDRPIAAKFTSDRRIVTLARDGKMREWICDYCGSLDDLIRTAKARLVATGRTFTPGERARFLSN